jgi:hypothetical protein
MLTRILAVIPAPHTPAPGRDMECDAGHAAARPASTSPGPNGPLIRSPLPCLTGLSAQPPVNEGEAADREPVRFAGRGALAPRQKGNRRATLARVSGTRERRDSRVFAGLRTPPTVRAFWGSTARGPHPLRIVRIAVLIDSRAA